ncbi:MAG: hypothetical protein KDJ37_02510 [Hyphomicrobiaceae bacterium]|nr:hypothetical protein [Hyphomicrobiaceae bacterium]
MSSSPTPEKHTETPGDAKPSPPTLGQRLRAVWTWLFGARHAVNPASPERTAEIARGGVEAPDISPERPPVEMPHVRNEDATLPSLTSDRRHEGDRSDADAPTLAPDQAVSVTGATAGDETAGATSTEEGREYGQGRGLSEANPVSILEGGASSENALAPHTTPVPARIASTTPPRVIAGLSPPVSAALAPRRRQRNDFLLAVHLAQRPAFCCCCVCLQPADRRRARRIFRIVRSAMKARRSL